MWKVGHSDGVIQLVDYFELPDFHLLVMERLGTSANQCKDLFDFISDRKRLEEDLAKGIFKQVKIQFPKYFQPFQFAKLEYYTKGYTNSLQKLNYWVKMSLFLCFRLSRLYKNATLPE